MLLTIEAGVMFLIEFNSKSIILLPQKKTIKKMQWVVLGHPKNDQVNFSKIIFRRQLTFI